MCELFGLSSAEKVNCNELLGTFFSHGETNPDGWGLALFDGNSASIEKEPISSAESVYLKHRLSDEITEDVVLAHIRKASKGGLEYRNCHPFKRRDASGRLWTLIHNGTIFESALLDAYMGERLGIPVEEKLLIRLKKTSPQKELNDSARRENLKNAFQVCGNDVKLKRVVLIDDIYTTGSTLDAAAAALLAAGVEKVYFLSICIGRGF